VGRWQTLMARDGHEFAAYLATPSGTPRGAVVILQEIFGVNEHIRGIAEQYAKFFRTVCVGSVLHTVKGIA